MTTLGQSGPKRVAWPALVSAAKLVWFTIKSFRSRGWAFVSNGQSSSNGSSPDPWTVHHDPLLKRRETRCQNVLLAHAQAIPTSNCGNKWTGLCPVRVTTLYA